MRKSEREVELAVDGQRFRLAGSVPLNGLQGGSYFLVGRCAECGAAFAQMANGRHMYSGKVLLRCATHRAAPDRGAALHPDATGEPPPKWSVDDLLAAVNSRLAAPLPARPKLDDVLVQPRRTRSAITARAFLHAIGGEWPGMNAMQQRLALSCNGMLSATAKAVDRGWLARKGVGPGTKFSLTEQSRDALAADAEVAHVE